MPDIKGFFGPRLHLGRQILCPPFFGIPYHLWGKNLASHLHIMGTTGVGKSKLLASVAAQFILQDQACSVIDPHADLAHDVLALLHHKGYFKRPDARRKVLYIDFSNKERSVPFNFLNQPYSTDETARLFVEACLRAWPALADGSAPQFENTMLAAATVLIENKLPLTCISDLLTKRDYRESLLTNVTDGLILSFFHDRFDKWGKDAPMLIESTLRRCFLLSYSPVLRYSLGQKENLLNCRAILDAQTSVLYNLGGLDEQTQKLLGCLLTVSYEQAALSRADIPEHYRKPYRLIMDEFSQFAASSEESLARVLSLCRKYGLFLIMANQTWSQLSARLQGAIQNTTLIYFKLGRDDSVWAAPRFGTYNPYSVKHKVTDEDAQERTHPVYFGVPDTYEVWAKRIEHLRPRHAFLRTRHRTVWIKTAQFPRTKMSWVQLNQLRDGYAQQLLTPRDSKQTNLSTTDMPLGRRSQVPAKKKLTVVAPL